jgi:hypothetical protein
MVCAWYPLGDVCTRGSWTLYYDVMIRWRCVYLYLLTRCSYPKAERSQGRELHTQPRPGLLSPAACSWSHPSFVQWKHLPSLLVGRNTDTGRYCDCVLTFEVATRVATHPGRQQKVQVCIVDLGCYDSTVDSAQYKIRKNKPLVSTSGSVEYRY